MKISEFFKGLVTIFIIVCFSGCSTVFILTLAGKV